MRRTLVILVFGMLYLAIVAVLLVVVCPVNLVGITLGAIGQKRSVVESWKKYFKDRLAEMDDYFEKLLKI